MLVKALQTTFDDYYPATEWRGVHCSIEYPVEELSYPGIWVDYEDTQPLLRAGVDHREFIQKEDGTYREVTRWRFQGYASYTIATLTSWQRDRLYDELVKVFAFSQHDPLRGEKFRAYIEDNAFIASNFDFDTIQPRGNAAAPGTPWGSDEIIYERTINMQVLGEFVPDEENSGELVPLSRIIIDPHVILPGAEPVPLDEADGWVIT